MRPMLFVHFFRQLRAYCNSAFVAAWVLLVGHFPASIAADSGFGLYNTKERASLDKVFSLADPLVQDLSTWVRIQRGQPVPPEDMINLLRRRRGWPFYQLCQERLEKALYKVCIKEKQTLSKSLTAQVTDFFIAGKGSHRPLSPEGVLVLWHFGKGHKSANWKAIVGPVWQGASWSADHEKAAASCLKKCNLCADDRFWTLVTTKDKEGLARAVKSPLKKENQAKAKLILSFLNHSVKARLTWAMSQKTVKHDPLVLWAYMRFLVATKKYKEVPRLFNVLDASPMCQKRLANQPKLRMLFYRLRLMAVRELLELGQYKKALKLVSNHGMKGQRGVVSLSEIAAYADCVWHKGWVELMFVDRPKAAAQSFKDFLHVVRSPISVSRGWYWLGAAEAKLKQSEQAKRSFEKAAIHRTTFYGQLALHRLGQDPAPRLTGMPVIKDAQRRQFAAQSRVKAIYLLKRLGPEGMPYIKAFLQEMVPFARKKWQCYLLLDLADKTHPSAFVDLARTFWLQHPDMPLLKKAYPFCRLPKAATAEEKASALSIIYKETRFDPTVVGDAGERGLMQVMLRTARKEAKALGLRNYTDDTLFQPAANIQIGLQHFLRCKKAFSYEPMAIGAYNAGDQAVLRWVKSIGHPDKKVMGKTFPSKLDRMINWIESIPFDSTRSYVQRYLETLTIYRARLGLKFIPLAVS